MAYKRFFSLIMVSGVFLVASITLEAQDKSKADHSYKPLTLKLNEDGSKYVRFIIWNQFWLTTNNLEEEGAKFQVTPSIRRSRFLAYSQISPQFLILTHFGINSLTPSNLTSLGNNGDAPQLFLHGAWGEVKLHDYIYVGGGLHYWKGLTRLSSQSTLNFMTLDQSRPFTAWHSLGITDQFARHLGVYLKGQVGDHFDYRFAVNSPLRNNIGAGKDYGMEESGLTYTGVSHLNEDDQRTGNTVIEGYVRYNFWEKESTKLPYNVGTYLGKKKVFALGIGFYAHPNGMYSDVTSTHESVIHFAGDAFLDLPIGKGDALNAYASFISFNYGENYVSRWAGTGTALYAQLGYFINAVKIMPYIAFNSGNYDGFSEPVTALDAGVNYFIKGHNAKVTFEYHRINGDTREGAINTQEDAISQLRLQLHFFL